MNGITPEAREAAAQVLFEGMVTTGPRLPQHDLYWACALDTVDALFAAGWGPVSVPVRPTVEALAEALKAAEESETTFNHTWTYHRKIAERLRAADHLWTEPATRTVNADVVLAALDQILETAEDWVMNRALRESITRNRVKKLREQIAQPSGSVPTETEGNKE